MVIRKFSLSPFPGEGIFPGIKIAGSIGRSVNRLSFSLDLLGGLSGLAIPAPERFPARNKRLWEETCLEFFLGERNSERYWEFNLSPSGDWNVYRFESFRSGMREEPAFSSLPFEVRREPGSLRLSLGLDIGRIISADKSIAVGVAAVIKTVTGETGHWALSHPGPRPDFHGRDGFRLSFSGRDRPHL